jgi:hypothetical protein
MEDTFRNNNIAFLFEKNQILVKANDLAKYVGIKNIRDTVNKYTNEEKCFICVDTKNGMQSTIFLTEQGIKRLLCSSRKPKSVSLEEKLDIKVHNKYVHLETSLVIYIKKTFKGEEILEQHFVENYILDLYLHKYNLAIEIDEVKHKWKTVNDSIKEDFVKNKLGCIY